MLTSHLTQSLTLTHLSLCHRFGYTFEFTLRVLLFWRYVVMSESTSPRHNSSNPSILITILRVWHLSLCHRFGYTFEFTLRVVLFWRYVDMSESTSPRHNSTNPSILITILRVWHLNYAELLHSCT